MGLDVNDLNLSVNIGRDPKNNRTDFSSLFNSGLPKTAWKIKQQQGRVGRNGLAAMDITLVFPQKGKSLPRVIYSSKKSYCLPCQNS